MNRFWFKGISCLSIYIVKIRYKVNNTMWFDNRRVKDKRTGVRIVK